MRMEVPAGAFAVLGAVLLGAVSPGPSFVLVARTAAASSRRDALAASLGMGIGGLAFAGAALLGMMGLLASVPCLYRTIKVIGACYLIYLAVGLWRSADTPLEATGMLRGEVRSIFRSFGFGLATQLSNPKTAIWYASIFAAAFPTNQRPEYFVIILAMTFMIEAGWYSIVAVTFSSAGPRNNYLRLKPWIDRAAGGVIGLLGLKLLMDDK
jgi:threonine/homoserine/homoserine lactone efflux protein